MQRANLGRLEQPKRREADLFAMRQGCFEKLVMSALGHKQTCAVQKGMSALLPIATVKSDFGKPSCLLCLRKRTCAMHQPMSAMGEQSYQHVRFVTNADLLLVPQDPVELVKRP